MERIKLTVSFLKTLSPGTSKKYADTETRGFQVWVGAKSIVFYLSVKFEYKQYNLRIGRWPDMTLEEARQVALGKLGALANHQKIDAPSPRKNPILADAIKFYLDGIENPHTKSCCRGYLDKFACLRTKRITDISRSAIQRIHDDLAEHPVMANHAVKKLATAISKLAAAMNIPIDNPARGIKFFPEKPRMRFLSEKEAPKVIKALKRLQRSWRHSVQADAILMMIYTGQRKSNVLSMNLAEIQHDIWVIPEEKSKSGREIVVPLNEFALEIVESRRAQAKDGFIFSTGRNGEGKGHLQDVRKTFRSACRIAGVKDCHIHDLRRTMGSWMLMSGVPISVVSKTLGHSSIAVTEQVYAHLLPGKIADATGQAVENMLKGKA